MASRKVVRRRVAWALPVAVGLCAVRHARAPFSAPPPSRSPAVGQLTGGAACFLGRAAAGGARGDTARAAARLLDYTGQASRLFDNMRAPASFQAGSTVPLGFFASPKPSADDQPDVRFAKRLHYLMAAVAICCELVTIVWSTIATNKLVETRSDPASSVTALLQRDYELEWIGCNVNFAIGLVGFASCLVTYSYVSFGRARLFVGCFVAASISLMVSVVNHGISIGDGANFRFSGNLALLFLRYNRLLLRRALEGQGVFVVAALLLYAASIAQLVPGTGWLTWKVQVAQSAMEGAWSRTAHRRSDALFPSRREHPAASVPLVRTLSRGRVEPKKAKPRSRARAAARPLRRGSI